MTAGEGLKDRTGGVDGILEWRAVGGKCNGVL